MEILFYSFLTHLQFGPRTSFWFRHASVLVFRKMSFLIHLDFSLLAVIIFRPLFTTFYLMLSTWYFTSCFMNFFWRKNYSHINCDFLFITFLNDLPHTMHVTSYGVSSLFSNVFNILHMNCLLEFRKITFTIHFYFTFVTGIIFRPLFDEIAIHGNVKITFLNVFNILHMNCLLEFCKMSFPIRLNFSPLTGIIF